jgi:hypothetical protein
MRKSIKLLVKKRANHRCEYCQMPRHLDVRPFQIDHIRARKHGGKSQLSNLALACFLCNIHKSSNAAGFDPVTDNLYPLFHPRRDAWNRHFRWNGARVVGKTAKGRTTIVVLKMNSPKRIEHRRRLIVLEEFP